MSSQQALIKLADQCVLCGICIPTCPTYQQQRSEAESPRGRISLGKALAEGKLSADPVLQQHLASCSGCLTCQQVCPAKVQYQKILLGGKQLLSSNITD